MKKILLFLSFLLMSIGVWGTETTYTFTSKSWGATPANWTSGKDGNSYMNSGIQVTTGTTGANGTSPTSFTDVSRIVVTYNTNKSKGSGTINFQIGTNTQETESWEYSGSADGTTANFVCTHNYTTPQSGFVKITLNTTTNSIYLVSVKIIHESVEEFNVKWVTNTDTIYRDTVQNGSQVDSVPNINIGDYCDDIFVGWTNSIYDGDTPPLVIFSNDDKPIITQDTAFYAVFANYYGEHSTTYVNTNINDIDSGSVVIIVGKNDGNDTYYAMSNDGGGGKGQPLPIEVDVYNNSISNPSANILWIFSVISENVYSFYKNDNTLKWLYCINDNNGIRTGTGTDNKTFEIDNNYLHNIGTSRYIGIYNEQDWRSYNNTTGNIINQSFYFFKQIPNINEYHTNTNCNREFNATQDNKWTTKENWTNDKLPTSKYTAQINKPIIVDTVHAVAKNVIINKASGNTGKVTILANKGLEVQDTISVYDGTYRSTSPSDLVLESGPEGNASLIFNNSNGDSATVWFYSIGEYPEGKTASWQYFGTTMVSANAAQNYYGSWIYKWVGVENDRWQAVQNGDIIEPWMGYCITQRSEDWHETSGQLIPTVTKVLNNVAQPYTVFANSWTAPIHIGEFENDDFVNIDSLKIYFFNTGLDPNGDSTVYQGRHNSPGTYVAVPIHSAPYLDRDSLIPSQQGFFVKTNKDGGSITLNYNKLVRTSGESDIVAGPLRSPKRNTTSNKPNVLKIYANGSKYSDRLTILEREDFSTGFDNGWDGDKMSFSEISPSIYVINEDGSCDEVSAIPDYEGTLLGFKSGGDSICTLTFEYNGINNWYINDMEEHKSTLISDENTYTFTSAENIADIRFVISKAPYSTFTTGIDNQESVSGIAYKYIYNGELYIMKNNHLYSVEGSLIK